MLHRLFPQILGITPDASSLRLIFTMPSRTGSERVLVKGGLPIKIKQLIAVVEAHVTQCPYCVHGHTSAALRHGATAQEIMEAIWVAAELRPGGAYAYSALALDTIDQVTSRFERTTELPLSSSFIARQSPLSGVLYGHLQ